MSQPSEPDIFDRAVELAQFMERYYRCDTAGLLSLAEQKYHDTGRTSALYRETAAIFRIMSERPKRP